MTFDEWWEDRTKALAQDGGRPLDETYKIVAKSAWNNGYCEAKKESPNCFNCIGRYE